LQFRTVNAFCFSNGANLSHRHSKNPTVFYNPILLFLGGFHPLTLLFFFYSFIFLFIPWYLLEKPEMGVAQIQFNNYIFLLNALSAFALNISIFLVIGRTGAVTIRVAGVLKDWILIALSTIIFPESIITSLNIIGYAIGNYVPFFLLQHV
jgi:hypothetical protein